MSSVLRPRAVSVSTENDVVLLRIGRAEARFSYGSALQIAQGLRLACNQAAALENVPRQERAAFKRPAQLMEAREVSAERRSSGERPRLRWEVRVEPPLVALIIGNVEARFEADTAGTLAGWLREQAKRAKAWAGDTSRTLRVAGTLTDAGAA